MSKGADTKQAILDEATRIASMVGLGGVTIGSLAARTQLSKSGLFAHFRSKESLQLQVLEHATGKFVDGVILPALDTPRGEPRLRELFDGWLRWASDALPGGCLFVAAGTEFDDQPGPVRDRLVRNQRDWMDVIAQVFRTGVADGPFRPDADPDQFAQDLYGVMLGYHHANRLLRDPQAEARARRAFEVLLDAARDPQQNARN
ncbi:TetR/AcrR family transcriptional regulator [Streptomyces sp. NPDC059010]|uniref:TetR/AcrR family transcriptional regulator n=1 Tax=Streptomyces sp. NPDC059010 TaxID=3346695 RepID=UPI0036ADE8E2